MSPAEKRRAIEKYFEPFPKWTIKAIVIGLAIAVIGLLGAGAELLAIGALVAAVGGAGAGMATSGKPSDADMDRYVEEGLGQAKDKALQKAAIDESDLVGEPLVVTGPRFWNSRPAKFLYKKGADNKSRYTPINVTVLCLTQHQMISYQAFLDLTTGNFLNEQTDEYFYKDVVSVATKTESGSFETPEFGTIQLNAMETFVLTTSGGTSIRTVLSDPKLIEIMGGGDLPTTDAERAIQVVRKMLREKKVA